MTARDRAPSVRVRRRPALLMAVFGLFLLLIGLTASGLVAVTSGHLSSATLTATVSRDASLVELFVNQGLRTDDLGSSPATAQRRAEIDRQLAALTARDAILRIDIRARDGGVRFSSGGVSATAAASASSQGLVGAMAGHPSAIEEDGADPADLAASLPVPNVVTEYLPLRLTNGETVAAVVLWRDASTVLAAIDATGRDILLLVLGASGVLGALLFVLFRAAQARIDRQQAELVDATRRDPTTQLLNHGALVTLLAGWVEEARGFGQPITVALLDIDNFRGFNATHGHAAGDEVLRRVATMAANDPGVLADATAQAAAVGRYGPDELAIAWRNLGLAEAQERTAAMRASVAELEVRVDGGERLPITASAGLASIPEHAESVTGLLSEAAQALGEAQASGGDALRVARHEVQTTSERGFDVLQGLVIAVDTKDRYTRRHSEDVARYAVYLARRMGLDAELLETLRVAGLLHDVGKIGIPDALLRRPGKLTAGEFEIFKQHVALGDAIVRDVPNLEQVRAGIRHHHERWDGGGYLDNLEGDEIPLIGRILAVADAFSAMTTTRPYRKALPVAEALKRLGDAAGTQLQEPLVAEFIRGIETDAQAPLPGGPVGRLWLPETRVA